jgi:hypothetical protein
MKRHGPLVGGPGITCALPATIASLPPAKLKHHPALIAAFALAHEVEGAPHEAGRHDH